MQFIGRKEEIQSLDRILFSPEGTLAVLWGRRRVGKSYLLREWAQMHQGVYHVADESSPSIQRKYFTLTIDQIIPGFSEVTYPDWGTLFSRLMKELLYLAKWKGPLIIDEFPYWVKTSPELPSILQRFIDKEAKQAGLHLVLCGSSQRMMQGAILDSSAPLYGRAQELLKLRPLSIAYMHEALPGKTARELIETYALWGGIPRYWELIQREKGSFSQVVEKLVLDPLGPLHEEPNRLLLEEAASHLRPVLDAIGSGSHRLSAIATRIGQSATSLMRAMSFLLELDFIQKEHPYGVDEANTKRSLYKIKDPFLRFWFGVVAPRRSFLSQASSSMRQEWVLPYLSPLFSLKWEELCRLAAASLYETAFNPAGRYWHKSEEEWDIVSYAEKEKTLLLGEAKWTSKSPSVSFIHKALADLQKKRPPSGISPQKILYALFVPEKPPGLKLPSSIRVWGADEVINALSR